MSAWVQAALGLPPPPGDEPWLVRWLTDGRSHRSGWLVWAAFLGACLAVVMLEPEPRTVAHEYRNAALGWWSQHDLYIPGVHGFLYLPQAAILYTPFALIPGVAGEVAWRLFGAGVLAWGVWRLCRVASGGDRPELFMVVSLLIASGAASSLRNGQMNTPLTAIMLHAAADLACGKWNRSAWLLALGLAVKPIGIVMLLLAGAVYPRTRPSLIVATGAVLALPFVCGPTGYVAAEYGAGVRKLMTAATPGGATFADIAGLLGSVGVGVDERVMLVVRAAAAVGVLGLCLAARRRFGGVRLAVYVLGVASAYLMLFNPRTENNSYIILAPAIAVPAAWALVHDGRGRAGWILAGVCVLLGLARTLANGTNAWLQPLCALVFLVYLAAWELNGSRREPALSGGIPGG